MNASAGRKRGPQTEPLDLIDSFDEYQKRASSTSQYKKQPNPNAMIVSLFGIGSEIGTLHDIAKKQFRNNMEGLSDRRDDIVEEIGDLLWYVAMLAKSFNVRLSDVARLNLEKTSDLHGRGASSTLGIRGAICERFPERMLFEFTERKVNRVPMAKMTLIAATPNDFPDGPISGYIKVASSRASLSAQ